MLECVINISEGADADRLRKVRDSAAPDLLDLHVDRHHNRSVLTTVGATAARRITRSALEVLDLSSHVGVHPRLGVVDVVPFVPLGTSTMADAIVARDDFARWAGDELGVPCFLYGPERTLPEIRRRAFVEITPDTGPSTPHTSAGAICVGARSPLVAYNLWLQDSTLEVARRIASSMRRPEVRALGLQVGDEVQVSMNLLDADSIGPMEVYDDVSRLAPIARAELVGLVGAAALARTPRERWEQLDVSWERTVESRVAAWAISPR